MTAKPKELAIFGKTDPQFCEPRHVGQPNLGNCEAFKQSVSEILERNWLTNNGPNLKAFEQEVADYLGVKNCVAICNGTIALEIAIRALGLQREVIVPSFTFIATAHALQWQEITPTFCDVDSATHNLDPAAVEALITPKTTGILGVHLWGEPCAIDELTEISDRHNLKLLFDASHAFGNTHGGVRLGNFGDAEVFSFHATKFVQAIEGGAIVTNNDELAEKMRLMRNFGFSGFENVTYLGTNGKMNEFSAAMGRQTLAAVDSIIARNHENLGFYMEGLQAIPGISLLQPDKSEIRNAQYIVAEIEPAEFGLERNRLVEVLHAENVLARRYFYPGCHKMEPYRTLYPDAADALSNTALIAERVLCLPTGTQTTEEDIGSICKIIERAQTNAHKINAFFSSAKT